MKTYVMVYEGFVQFEVVLTNYFMNTVGELITVGLDKKKVTSLEGVQIVPHITIDEVDIEDVDLFVIPGGEPETLYDEDEFYELIKTLNENDKIIGTICATPVHLAKAGILEDKKYTTTLPIDEFDEFESENYLDKLVVKDDNIVTAKARGYVDFAIELGKTMDIFEDEEDLQESIDFFKNYKI